MLKAGFWTRRLWVVLLIGGLLAPVLPADTAEAAPSVADVQRALREKKFYRGSVDGRWNTRTQHAIMAFRKEIGATRSYSWSSSLWDDLQMYQAPYTRHDEPDRVEINLTKQTAHLFRDGEHVATFPVASGNGEYFENSRGQTIRAVTPTGSFKVFRREYGWYTSYLGSLLDPWFFNGGIALHGSNSVPAYPASHGCVRLTTWDSAFINSYMYIGMPVHVFRQPRGTGPVYGSDGPFADVSSSHTFVTEIQWMVDERITFGCSEYFYCPKDTVTRGMMAAFFNRFLSLPSTEVDYFRDDGGSIFQGDINELAESGITRGCNPPANDRFCPDRRMDRGAMAAFLRRALELPYVETDYFADDNGSIFENDINAIAAAGITTGCATGYCPTSPVTREVMAAFLYRARNLRS